MAYQRKTRRKQHKDQRRQTKHGGYVWNTKTKTTKRHHKSSTIKSRSSSKKTKSAYSMLPNVIY